MATQKSIVGVGVESSTAFGRQIMRGIMRYSNIHRRWLLAEEFNVFATDPAAWPQCDGAIVTEANAERIAAFKKRCTHLISCSGGAEGLDIITVTTDNFAIGRIAAEHLMECRLTRFAVYGWRKFATSNHRIQGFSETLARHNHACAVCPVEFEWSRQLSRNVNAHWAQLIPWLQSLPKPIGIFALDDMIAHDLAGACLKSGIHVPDEIAIIGVNNDDLLCESSWPPLSSIQCDYQRVGYIAAEMMDQLLSGKSIPPDKQTVRLPPVGVVKRISSDLLAVENRDLAAALQFIREHCCDPCSVDDILRHIPVGRRWLERMFTEHIGHSPYEEITRARMKRAEELLLKSDMCVLDIARMCGFADTPNFNRQFRQITRETPAAFRRARKIN